MWYNGSMTPKLNDEQIKALAQHADGPLPVEHPGTNKLQRVIDALQSQVLDRFGDGQRVVAVIHGGPISAILDWIEHDGFTGSLNWNIETASVTLLRRGANGLEVVYLSDTSHLKNLS